MDFINEEYITLIEDRNHRNREIRRLEIIVAGAITSLYAWFLSDNPSNEILWFLPPILGIFGLYRSIMLKRSIDYICLIYLPNRIGIFPGKSIVKRI